MGPINEPLQVEILAPWWASALPAIALAVSLASIALTLWFRYGDGVRIRAEWHWSYPVYAAGPLLGDDEVMVGITVTNGSRSTATDVQQVTLENHTGAIFLRQPLTLWDTPLPSRLEPGQSLTITYQARGLGITILRQNVAWVRIKVDHGHGTFRGPRDHRLTARLRAKGR